jgi:N-acyl-D-amino-acid deacylase
VDLRGFFREFERQGYPVNQAELVGHTNLRQAAGQDDLFAPMTKKQTETAKSLMRDAFSCGAAGISFGLEYAPGTPAEEVYTLSRCAADAGRLVTIHTRLNKTDDFDSLCEALDIAQKTGARVIISHLVYMYFGNGLKRAVDIIERYRSNGADIWVDSGMYTAFATFAGTPVFDEQVFSGKGYCVEKVRAATGKYAGRYLNKEQFSEIRRDFPGDSLIYDPGNPSDIFTAYALPDVMVSTDCIKYPPGQGHPQGAATFPYFLRVMVKEKNHLTLQDAIRRCTLIPAQALGYAGKGRLALGADADLVVLDWERLRERAVFPDMGNPDAPPEGVKHVFVNGLLAIENEMRVHGVYAGKCLYAGNSVAVANRTA